MHPYPAYNSDRHDDPAYLGESLPVIPAPTSSTTMSTSLSLSTSASAPASASSVSSETASAWPASPYNLDASQEQLQQPQLSYHQNSHPSQQDRSVGISRPMRDQSVIPPFADLNTFNLNTRPAVEPVSDSGAIFQLDHPSPVPLDATRPISRIQVEFALPQLPGKARKRHKVATSCNRCRQNKRKCDSGVPCSNCKRNNVDCCYTDAQLSRTIWGDSPLSQEKVIGVAANRPNATGTGRSTLLSSYGIGSSNSHPLFYQEYNMSNDPLSIGRQQQVLSAQSKNISKALRVAQQGISQFPTRLHPKESSAVGEGEQHIVQGLDQAGGMASVQRVVASPPSLEGQPQPHAARPTGNAAEQTQSRTSWQHGPENRPFPSMMHSQTQSAQGLQHQQQQQPYETAGKESGLSSGIAMQGGYDSRNARFMRPSADPQKGSSLFPSAYPDYEGLSLGTFHVAVDTATTTPPSRGSGADNTSDVGPSSNPASYAHQHQDSDLLVSPISLTPLQQQQQQRHEQEQDHHVQQQQHHHRQLSSQSSEYSHNSTFVSTMQQILPPGNSSIGSGPRHAIYPAAPSISTFGSGTSSSSGSYNPLDPWQAPTLSDNGFSALYTGTSVDHTGGGYQQQGRSSHSVLLQGLPPVHRNKDQVDETVGAMHAEERLKESRRMQKIANDILAIKKYDLSIRIPRHISQEQDEFFIISEPYLGAGVTAIPSHLQLLPRDANYLVDVFFENAYFYYPVINRTVVELCLMEPQTSQALFLLNIVFMTACKHLGRLSDIKRAIQFRECAREVQLLIDTRVRLTRMQTLLLGSLVVYGVFKVASGYTEICGAYSSIATTPSLATDDSYDETFPDLQAESQYILAKKGIIPEAAYQARLWTFWGFYIRDSISRLYFGWPYGLDSMAVMAELPKIEGSVGLGGRRGWQSQMYTKVIGKRKDSPFNRDHNAQFDKRHMAHPEGATVKTDRGFYRSLELDSDDDGDDDDSQFSWSKTRRRNTLLGIDDDDGSPDQSWDEKMRFRASYGVDGLRKSGSNTSGGGAAGGDIEPFSVLSPKILEQQSRHGHLDRQTGTGTDSHVGQQDLSLHMERMKLMADAEDDTTDSGSYARVLFLEEIRLWSLGRRVALYLAGRMGTAASGGQTVSSTSPRTRVPSSTSMLPSATVGQESGMFPAVDWLASNAHKLAGQWSEQAWIQDQELQTLQGDLIAWEKALPHHLRFRPDVEKSNVNHKVNGKMGLMIMSYYTITIMLQTSYLPIPQGTSPSRSRASPSSAKLDGRSNSKDAGDAFRNSNPAGAGSPGDIQSTQSTAAATSATDATHSTHQHQRYQQQQFQPSQDHNNYYNTAHQICTELSNVLLHHIELLLDTYPEWCTIQAKINHALTSALRVSCLNAKLRSNSTPARQEAKAGFKMGSDLFKRLALMPYPLTIRDWPVEEDVQLMMEIEEEFKEMMMTQEEQEAALPSSGAGAEHFIVDGVTMDEAFGASLSVGEEGEHERTFEVRQQPIFGMATDDYKFEFDHCSTLE